MAVIFGTSGNDRITGTAVSDIIFGQAGDDTIDGGSGRDFMSGGAGNDTFIVNSNLDDVFENANEGFDTVVSFVTFTLPDNVEALTLTGTGGIDGTGNALANFTIGNSANNLLQGLSGNDTLIGLAGNDVFIYAPGDGADTILDFTGAGVAAGDAVAFVNSAGFGVGSFAQLLPLISDVAGGCRITFNANDSLLLLGVAKAQLTAADFAFL